MSARMAGSMMTTATVSIIRITNITPATPPPPRASRDRAEAAKIEPNKLNADAITNPNNASLRANLLSYINEILTW